MGENEKDEDRLKVRTNLPLGERETIDFEQREI